MAIRWESYRNRKRLDPAKWASYLKITTYKSLCDRLLKMGIIPPERHHPDFVEILSDDPGDVVQKKPSSGRVHEKEVESIDNKAEGDKKWSPKPTSGRASDIIVPVSHREDDEVKSASSKPKQKRRRRKTTRKTSPSSKKPLPKK